MPLGVEYCQLYRNQPGNGTPSSRRSPRHPNFVHPVDWKDGLFSQLPVLRKNHEPVTSWGDRDAAFQGIAEGIREVAIELRRVKDEGAISSNF